MFTSPRKVNAFYKATPQTRPRDVKEHVPAVALEAAINARVERLTTELEEASADQLLQLFQPSPIMIVDGREAEYYSAEYIVSMAKDIRAVTGKWPMPDEVKDEIEFRRKGGIAALSYGELMELSHYLYVTGRKGCFSPVDLTAGDHWIPCNSLRTKVATENSDSVHTRLSFHLIPFISTHHVPYAIFKSRAALINFLRPRHLPNNSSKSKKKAVIKKASLLHCSHRCHIDACVHPDHLTGDTPLMNRQRSNKCLASKFCIPEHHAGQPCVITSFDKTLIPDMVSKPKFTMTVQERIRMMQRHRVKSTVMSVRASQIMKLLRSPTTRAEAVATYERGLNTIKEEEEDNMEIE
jgi:hypothetical protein